MDTERDGTGGRLPLSCEVGASAEEVDGAIVVDCTRLRGSRVGSTSIFGLQVMATRDPLLGVFEAASDLLAGIRGVGRA